MEQIVLSASAMVGSLRMDTVLAVKNLIHDRVRLLVTLIGVTFAVVLINVEVGLFIGFEQTASGLIDHAGADLWVMAPGTRNVDQVAALSERRLYQVLAVPGVGHAAKLNIDFAFFKRPDGGSESTIVVGFNPDLMLGGPWNLATGDVRDLRYPDTIVVDELYRAKLGITHLGQVVEIDDRRAQVVGFTRGIRSFSQSPYVFASERTSHAYSGIRSDQTKYILVTLAPGADLATVQAAIGTRLPDVEVLTTAQFRHRTQFYWMFSTGAGLALLVAAIMGLAVGIVVVSQTLYATTVDHLPEFGTLRAMGASNEYIYTVIIKQAIAAGVVGYVIGLIVTLLAVAAAHDAGPALSLPWWMVIGMFVVTVGMCIGAAVISIKKITRLDPSMVFK